MCLVSFIPLENSIVITSSRDEDTNRARPLPVREWTDGQKRLNYPRDVKGGTWIGYDQFNNFLVILNGARTKHTRADSYRKSRGLIVLELLDAKNILNAWTKIDLTNIEPFTLLHYSVEGQLWEWIWDSEKKLTTQLDTKKFYCWLSSTLYTPEEWVAMKVKFHNRISKLTTPQEIRTFHLENRYETKPTGIIYPTVKTVSNTTAEFKEGRILFNYLDVR